MDALVRTTMFDIPDITLPTAALAATCRPLAEASTLPGVVYTSAGVFTHEMRELFGRSWLALAREEDLPDPGSFITHELAAERVLIVRAEDARLRAFYNVCRHRGSRLIEEPRGTLKAVIACPYHAWTYGFDGRFRRAPRMEVRGQEDALALTAMPLDVRDGCVFINLDSAAAPLAQQLADLPDFSRYCLDTLRRVRCLDYEIGANWKIICENYSECYHCPLVHPQLNRIGDITSGGFEQGASFNGGPMQLREGFTTLSMSGRSRWPRLGEPANSDASSVYYYLVYPNLMLGIHPDYLLTHRVWPLAAARSRVVCEVFVPPAAFSEPDFDASEIIEFWDLTNRQDWALCERVQRGAASRGYRPGPYHPSERCVHAFDRWYAQWLLPILSGKA